MSTSRSLGLHYLNMAIASVAYPAILMLLYALTGLVSWWIVWLWPAVVVLLFVVPVILGLLIAGVYWLIRRERWPQLTLVTWELWALTCIGFVIYFFNLAMKPETSALAFAI